MLPVGPPVPRQWQIGREGDIARLADQLRGGDHTVLADLRRTGKTTVALAALDLLASDGWIVAGLDLTESGEEGGPALAEVMVSQVALQRARGRIDTGLGYELWDLLRPSVGLSGDDAQAVDDELAAMRASGSAGAYLTWAFDDVIAAGREGKGAVVFLDEVQALDYWRDQDAVSAEIGGRLRQPDPQITLLFAGSEPSLVSSLFAKGGLLELDAVDFHLSPIDAQPWREGLRRAFRELGLNITDDAVDHILRATHGEPHRTMLVANRTAEVAQFAEVDVADEALADEGLEAARRMRLWTAGS